MNLKLNRVVTNGKTLVINGIHWIPIRNNKRQLKQDRKKLTILSND
jgi:2-phosphoglycerate kinase